MISSSAVSKMLKVETSIIKYNLDQWRTVLMNVEDVFNFNVASILFLGKLPIYIPEWEKTCHKFRSNGKRCQQRDVDQSTL